MPDLTIRNGFRNPVRRSWPDRFALLIWGVAWIFVGLALGLFFLWDFGWALICSTMAAAFTTAAHGIRWAWKEDQ